MRSTKPRRLIAAITAGMILTAGLVLAAQESGRADRFADPTDKELLPRWVPGSDVPMVTYLDAAHDLALAPPR